MRWGLLSFGACSFLGACSFHLPGGSVGGGSDGGSDASGGSDMMTPDLPPPVDGCTSFSTQFDTCAVQFSEAVTIGANKLYNTDTHVLSDFPSGANGVVLDGTQQIDVTGKAGTINVWLVTTMNLNGGQTLRVVGTKPFGIVASDKITIDGLLDGRSSSVLRGAGSLDAGACGTATPAAPPAHVGGAAGGGGGAFQGAGGHGGDSDSNEGGSQGANGGVSQPSPSGPRGGCPGSRGGNTGGSQTGGPAGDGGGAIYLVSQTFVEIHAAGQLNAGGAGGQGGRNIDGGGGAGGSGGMIILEGPMVKVDGTLAANGGAGGGGAGGNTAGGPGGDGLPSAVAAVGGSSASNATPGVQGSAGGNLDGASNTAARLSAAGGGGGGGAGYISIVSGNQSLNGSTITPALTTLPP